MSGRYSRDGEELMRSMHFWHVQFWTHPDGRGAIWRRFVDFCELTFREKDVHAAANDAT